MVESNNPDDISMAASSINHADNANQKKNSSDKL